MGDGAVAEHHGDVGSDLGAGGVEGGEVLFNVDEPAVVDGPVEVAFVVAGAFFGDGEIEADLMGACGAELRGVLLAGGETVVVGDGDELNRPVFCIRSGLLLGLDVGSGFERSSGPRTRRAGCRRARCAAGAG